MTREQRREAMVEIMAYLDQTLDPTGTDNGDVGRALAELLWRSSKPDLPGVAHGLPSLVRLLERAGVEVLPGPAKEGE